jgi:hypothetical protein
MVRVITAVLAGLAAAGAPSSSSTTHRRRGEV